MGTLAGIAVGIAALWFINDAWGRSTLAERAIKQRNEAAAAREKQGVEIMDWPLLQETSGGYRSGPTFDERLLEYDGTHVNMVGFQVPLEEFRNMKTFLLLPMPIECYFCQSPPMRDVVLVHMKEGQMAPLIEEPVFVNGILKLNKGPKTSFFYELIDTEWGVGDPSKKDYKRREVAPEHMMPHNREEELLEPSEPPKASDAVLDQVIPQATEPVPAPAPEVAPAAPEAAAPVVPDGSAVPAPAEPEPAPAVAPEASATDAAAATPEAAEAAPAAPGAPAPAAEEPAPPTQPQ